MNPTVERLDPPPGYGQASQPLTWARVRALLQAAPVYWLATVRPDGRPHVVPRDGFWIDDALFYGGSLETVHRRNLQHNPHCAATIGDGPTAVIVEGDAGGTTLDRDAAVRLAAAHEKYPQYGLPPDPDTIDVSTLLVLRPRRVMAWTAYPADCTRFTFDAPQA